MEINGEAISGCQFGEHIRAFCLAEANDQLIQTLCCKKCFRDYALNHLV